MEFTGDIKKLVTLLERYCGDIEIVSYGLAPNPFGFCYEIYTDDIPKKDLQAIDRLLDGLSVIDELILRNMYI